MPRSPLAVAALVVLCEALAFSAYLPVIDAHVTRLGAASASQIALWTGLLMMLVSLPKVAFSPLIGWMSDRVGRRPALALATAGTLAGSVLWAVGSDLWWLVLARGITGVFAAQAGLAQAIAADVSPPHRRAAAIGAQGAAFGSALALGPLLGGYVADTFSTHAVGWASAALQGVSLLSILLLLPETRPTGHGHAPARFSADLRQIFAQPGVKALLAVTMGLTVATSQLVAVFSIVMSEGYRFSNGAKGWGWAVFGIVAIVVQGGVVRRLSPRYGELRLALGGFLTLTLGLLLMTSRVPLPLFWTAVALLSIGVALATPTLSAMLTRCVTARQQGALSGINQAVLGLGRASGNVLGGALFALGGQSATFLTAATVAVIGMALLIVSSRAVHAAAAANERGEATAPC